MRDIAVPAHIPPGRSRFAPAWRWPSVLRWWFAVGEDGVLRSSRLQTKTQSEQTMAGDPDPAQRVDQLFQEHADIVLAYLIQRLPSLPDAEDALNEVFLAALRASSSGQILTSGWLIVTAQHRVADFYRQRQRALPFATIDAADKQRASESSEPEWVALRGEEHRELLRLVARLPQEQQDILALRFAAALQSPEIGVAVGKRAGAVRALLTRAMRRLREEWTR
jgi:RNA polymerase sigma-70 factor (ECF subfamily)